MEAQHRNILKIYNYLSIALIIIVSSNIWFFYTLNKNYEVHMAKIIEKVATIEKEIMEETSHSTVPEMKSIDDVEDLREYIMTQYPKVLEKDIDVIAFEINKHCLKHDIPFSLIVGLIDVESSYNKFAKSNKDSYGLMQIRYSVWGTKLNIRQKRDLYRIKVNIGLGIGVLKYYIDQNNGNVVKALQDYNGADSKKFPDKVHKAIKKFTDFRLAYEYSIAKIQKQLPIQTPNIERVK
jgi:hypothetical protein